MPDEGRERGWAVWVQAVDELITPGNLEKYGEVQGYSEYMYPDLPGADFCDGQVSAMAPRWADDEMGQLWFYDESVAREVGAYLRNTEAERFAAGDLAGLAEAPSWMPEYLGGIADMLEMAERAHMAAEFVDSLSAMLLGDEPED